MPRVLDLCQIRKHFSNRGQLDKVHSAGCGGAWTQDSPTSGTNMQGEGNMKYLIGNSNLSERKASQGFYTLVTEPV